MTCQSGSVNQPTSKWLNGLGRIQPRELQNQLPLGTSNPERLRWAEQDGFVRISNDARTLPGHFAAHFNTGHHSPGVFLIALPASITRILEARFYYADASDDDTWRDQILFNPWVPFVGFGVLCLGRLPSKLHSVTRPTTPFPGLAFFFFAQG
jgi:hypothetical protein